MSKLFFAHGSAEGGVGSEADLKGRKEELGK